MRTDNFHGCDWELCQRCFSPPQITRTSKTNLQLRKGDNTELFCEGKGSPAPKIIWKKDGYVLNNTLRVTVEGNRVKIVNLQREDGGIYSCTFLNSVGETSQPIKLVLEGGPVIMQVPGNMTVLEGQRVLLPCATEGFPNPIFYTWYKDNIDIRTTESYAAQRVVIQDDGSLLIKPAVKGDRGWYTCKPSNTLGHDEASAYLNVVYKPEVLKMPSQITWAKTYLQQIDCPVDSNPPLTGVTWIKDMTMLTTDSGRYDLLKNGTLLVAEVEDSDAGSYRCIPTNALGQGLSSPRVQVIVRDKPDPPQITVSPQTLYIRTVGDSVQMRCEATGTPAVSLQWIKVGSRLESNERVTINDKFLEIKNLTKEDHGKYECKAINQIATVVSVTELRIDNTTPHAPYNVTVTAGAFNVTITWEPAYDGGIQQYYFVWFRPVSYSNWVTMAVPGSSATSYTLYNLQPDTEYEFKILSRNSLGDGSYSSVVRQRTLGKFFMSQCLAYLVSKSSFYKLFFVLFGYVTLTLIMITGRSHTQDLKIKKHLKKLI